MNVWRKRYGTVSGFSIIEVMITIMVFVLILPGLSLAFMNYYSLNEITGDIVVATEDARRVIEQMRNDAVTSLTPVTNADWTAWCINNGCNSLSGEQVVVTYADRDNSGTGADDDPLEVTVTVNWQQMGGRPKSLGLSTLITSRGR